ncbi:MAG TPA: CDP-diacylglycerol O-phosphatidyltransferase [Methylomirabilota bacterium]
MPLTAWIVHALTASGALLAYLALRATAVEDLRAAFVYLALATAIDAVDGWLARRAHVKARIPWFDGARLDDIVDYLTFVFAPVWILDRAGALPSGPAGPAVAAAVLLSSAYGFSRTDAKSADHFFTGFPSYWNIVALYLVALGLGPVFNAAVLLAFVAAVFVPIGYIYPSRTPHLQRTTVALGLVWGAMALAVIWWLPAPPRWLVVGSLFFPVYYVGISLHLHRRRTL